MYRILAIDYGEARIGIALSDPLHIISKPYEVIQNSGFENTVIRLNEIIKEMNVGLIVLGMPYNLKGEDSQKTLEVKEFYNKLKQTISIPIKTVDERYTTVDANESLIKMGYSIKDSRKVIDMVAASLILRNYLNTL